MRDAKRSLNEPKDKRNLLLLSSVFGTSFGTLVLYGSSFVAIALILLFVTAAVSASSREDLRGLAAHKIFISLIVMVAVFEISASLSVADQIGSFMFELLMTISFVLLILYSVASRASRTANKLSN